jgi:D-alanine-D-alanine ligase
MKVLILHNDVSLDHSPSDLDVLYQVDAVRAALQELGHAVETRSCTLDLTRTKADLEATSPDVVFNLIESLANRDRLGAAGPLLLDALRIPYTGVPTAALLVTNGKLTTKARLLAAQLPTAPWWTDVSTGWHGLPWPTPDARPELDPTCQLTPLMIKAVWEHASFHMDDSAIVSPTCTGELAELVQAREARTGQPHFAEPFLEGREFNLSVLGSANGPVVLPPAEIDFSAFPVDKPRIVGYTAKWHENSFEFQNTPRSFEFPPQDANLLAELSRLAIACWHAFDLRGYVRVDFRVDRAGRSWILEINSNPCLSPDAGFYAAVGRAGLSFADAVERILEDAMAAARGC